MKKNIPEVIRILKGEYPDAKIALDFEGNWQLLVAVILSAQCTDERVNKVTPALFKRFPTVDLVAGCDILELEKLIYSTGFYKNKAKNIRAAAVRICEVYGGEVPDTMEELLTLPGVARKTANVVLYSGFGKVEGIVVDTHVTRLTTRLGWLSPAVARSKNAVRIERELMKRVPRREWGGLAHLLILHGRAICVARKPRCEHCCVSALCPSSRV